MKKYLIILGHNYICITQHIDGMVGEWKKVIYLKCDYFCRRNKLKYLYTNRYGNPVYELRK